MNIKSSQDIVWIAFFTALMAISAFISIPIGPIPFTLQILTIFLVALILGSKKAFYVVALYLFLGAIGFPLFSGAKSGLAAFMSPTGGFLIAFLPGIALAGLAKNKGFITAIFILLISLSCIYALGASWLMYTLKLSLEKTIAVAVAPFILFDIVKIFLAYFVYKILKKRNKLP